MNLSKFTVRRVMNGESPSLLQITDDR